MINLFTRNLAFAVFAFICIALVGIGVGGQESFAQTPNQTTNITAPMSEGEVKEKLVRIEDDTQIEPEDKAQITEIYKNAIGKLGAGRSSDALAKEYQSLQEKAPVRVEYLKDEIADIRKKLLRSQTDLAKDYEDKSVAELEQILSAERANAIALRNLKAQYDRDLHNLDQRPVQASQEIVDLEEQIAAAEISVPIVIDDKAPSKLEVAADVLRRTKLYADAQKKRELEQELASMTARRSVLAQQYNLVISKINHSNNLLTVLDDRTGSARTDSAMVRLKDAKSEAEEFANDHPLVQEYAAENVALAQRNLEIAQSEVNLPNVESSIATNLQQVRLDTNVAKKILDSKKVNKAYGEHLRSLRKKQPYISEIQQQINAREIALQDALFQRITTQEDLDTFNATPLDFNVMASDYKLDHPQSEPLSETDRAHLQRANDSRRGHLNELAAISALRSRKLEQVNALNRTYLSEVKALCALLDSRLLWLPSTEPIGLSWPGKVIQGVGQTFTASGFKSAGQALVSGLRNAYFLIFLALALLAGMHILRKRLKPLLKGMSSRVGRVQKDNYSLTPIAIVDGMMRAGVFAGFFVVLSLVLYFSSVRGDFVEALMLTSLHLAGPVFIFSCLRSWSFKKGLFDLHFWVDTQLRHRLLRHIPWLIVALCISVFLVGMTRGNLDFDSGAGALGVFGFIFGALGISWFTIKLAWSRKATYRSGSREGEGLYLRNERWFFIIATIFPIATALLAALGYFETGQLLLSRFFMTFIILIIVYVTHGLLKRSLVIAQRRLALEQARERRDRAVKERMAKAAAEERGEIPVPKVDTESIDLETINRQSNQLINVAMFVAGAVGIWAVWSNILPALSVFNDVQLWEYLDVSAEGGPKKVPITLWNVMQAVGIGFLTWLAVRNLPGFLEMFVLKRTNLTQSTRFAIVTILGYLIFTVGALVAFDKLGTQWSQLQWIVAAFGVGIGFGLQAIFANFISGLILLFERPVRIGDYITVGQISGSVTRIKIRATTLLDLDNKEILIPNQELVTQDVTNWTLDNPITRLKIPVGIAYGSDTQLAHQTMMDTINANRNVLNSPKPSALFLEFGESNMNFELRIFLRDFTQRYRVSHEIHMALDEAFREVGIEIAFPQIDMHVKNPEAFSGVTTDPLLDQPHVKKTSPKNKKVAKVLKTAKKKPA